MGDVHEPVKGFDGQKWATTVEGIRARLKLLLEERGWSAAELARQVGLPPKNVQRLLGGTTDSVPAELVGRLEEKGIASARWLFTEEGTMEPIPPPEAEVLVAAIRRLVRPGRRREELEALADWLEKEELPPPDPDGEEAAS